MGVLNKMRERAGMIFGGLAVAFLIMIVFEWGAQGDFFRGGGPRGDEIGEVNGLKITSKEYEDMFQQLRQQKLQEGKVTTLSEADESDLRDKAWDEVVMQKLVAQKIDELGIEISDQEVRDLMFYSPPDFLKRPFIDSATGQFKQAEYFAALRDPRNDTGVAYYATMIREDLKRMKLQGFMQALARTTNEEMWERYERENAKATALVTSLRIDNMELSKFAPQVTDDEVKKYYDNHQYEFKRDAAKRIKMVIFEERPTPKDSAVLMDRLSTLKSRLEQMALTEPDSIVSDIVADYSDAPPSPRRPIEPQVVSQYLNGGDLLNAAPGQVIILRGQQPGQMAMAKVFGLSDSGGSQLLHVRHILIGAGIQGKTNKDSARMVAEQVSSQLKAGGNFAELAARYSIDGSARNGGDLGWSSPGQWVPEFADAAMSAPLNTPTAPVETQFGFHIIEVLGKSTKRPIAMVVPIRMKPSSQTLRMIEQQARVFREQALDKGFDQQAKDQKLRIINEKGDELMPIQKSGQQPIFGYKPFTDYVFGLSAGDITEPYRIPGSNIIVVAQVVEDLPKGTLPLGGEVTAKIKETLAVRKMVQAKEAKAKELRALIGPGETLEKLGTIDSLYKPQMLTFGPAESAPGLGTEYNVNIAAFDMKPGEISQPIKGDRGYFIIQLISIAPASKDTFEKQKSTQRTQLQQEKINRLFGEWFENLKNEAKIVDYRSKLR